MQHYAALGGDARGARAVNLENGDRPADIYSGVADLVNKVIQHDSAKGVKLAQLIGEPLGRKVVKQTVMTTVYGKCTCSSRPDTDRSRCDFHWSQGSDSETVGCQR
jgi:DNA-directed RNA polymerase